MVNRLVSNTEILAKTSGVSLYDHTQHLFDELKTVLLTNPFIKEKFKAYFDLSDSKIDSHFSYIISYHDWGKAHYKWQKHCKENNLMTVEVRHEVIYILKIIENITKNSITKKPLSEIKDYYENVDKIYFLISPILSHHSNLSKNKLQKINRSFQYLTDKEKELLGTISIWDFIERFFNSTTTTINIWYKQAFYRYLLQLCDKNASIKENDKTVILPVFSTFNFNKDKYKKLRKLQIIAKKSKSQITILRASTGEGKTLASILWANEQITNNKADRLVIAMPTQFTSNALSTSVASYVDDTKVQHGNSKMFYSNHHEYRWIRSLQSSVSVCTIDHLLIAMSLNSEENQHVLFNLSNSCLVIDEADFYDNFIQANIIKLINFLIELNVSIMIMSATLPDRYVEILKNNIKDEKIKNNLFIQDGTSDMDRVRVNVKSIATEYDYTKILDKKTAIIYCNTRDRAKDTYQTLIDMGIDVNRIVLYHSELTESDKRSVERRILEKLGEEAWRNNTADGIIIMTQIGELSINISSDYMVCDVCPMDRLVQRWGRGGRFDFLKNRICDVDIITPEKNGVNYPAPYGNYLNRNDGWFENIYLTRTKELLKVSSYTYRNYIDAINIIYKDLDIDKKSKTNSEKLLYMNNSNTFINKGYNLDEGINETDWKTRDIAPHAKIYIGTPNEYYNTYDEFKYFMNMNTVNIPIYKYKQYLNKLIMCSEVKVFDNTEIVYFIDEKLYISCIGIDWNK